MRSLVAGREGEFPEALEQLRIHSLRFWKTLQRLPQGAGRRLLDVSGTSFLVPILLDELGYASVTLTSDTPNDRYTLESVLREKYGDRVRFAFFDAEEEEFPFDDASFDQVVCTEVLEHMVLDPMKLMSSINRVLAPEGTLLLTTPNSASLQGIVSALRGIQPSGWAYYCTVKGQHHREYTVSEVERLLDAAGFGQCVTTTFDLTPQGRFESYLWAALSPLRMLGQIEARSRKGQFTCITGRRISRPRDRYPDWLYYRPMMGELASSSTHG